MEKTIRHRPHCVHVIYYHLVWIPRDRKEVLVGPIETRLKTLRAEIAQQHGFQILAVEVMPDHVHFFVSGPPKFSPSEIVRYFKGIPSRRLKHEFVSVRRQYWSANATLWAEGYSVGPAGQASAETIRPDLEECQKD